MPDQEELRKALGADKPSRENLLNDVIGEISEKIRATLQNNAGNKLSNELCIGMHGVLRHDVEIIIRANQNILEEPRDDED